MGLFDFFKRKTPHARFVEEMKARFDATGVFADLRYQPENVCFSGTKPDGSQLNIFLNNVYEYASQANADEREATITRFVRSTTDLPEVPHDYALAKAKVMPSVRSRMDTAVNRLLNPLHGMFAPNHVAWPVAADLEMLLSYDGADSIVRLDADHVVKWGIDRDELYAQAVDNLRLRGPEQFNTTERGLHLSAWQDDYDNARLLLPDVLRRLPVTGELLAMGPSRNDLFVTGSEQRDAILEMSHLANQVLENAPRYESAAVLVLRGDRWQEWTYDPADYPTLARVQRLWLARDYANQKDLLEQLAQKQNDDIFVATHMLTEHNQTKALTTYATWTEGVRALLPHADVIVFTRGDKTMQVPWPAAQRIVGDHLARTTDYPVRYRVEHFPDQAQWAALQQVADD